MLYRRLKTINSTGVPIMRYYDLADGQTAYTNCFYDITDGKCSKLSGTPSGELIGFSHGGDRLVKGKMLLDITPTVVYMGIFEEGEETRPEIGELVNGYQKVIDTHYDGDEEVTEHIEWGVEVLDNPYYLFTIVQPEGSEQSVDDSTAGTPTQPAYPVVEPEPERPVEYVVISFDTDGGSFVPGKKLEKGYAISLALPTEDPTKDGYTFGGWFMDAECTTEVDDQTASSDTTVYAKFTEN